MNIDFEPKKAFKSIDEDQDGQIDENEIIAYLKKNYLRVSASEA